eukprot:TRINITY_DN911_c6_g1_i1.p1 TRINITY_DN911_c6_g1~~TRINITY_DN911_c6_g1_i1.p1  ORF type:complete len:428 (+),score=60.29 TRINITY_DN911_c6_g1_i1:68-1285(+)
MKKAPFPFLKKGSSKKKITQAPKGRTLPFKEVRLSSGIAMDRYGAIPISKSEILLIGGAARADWENWIVNVDTGEATKQPVTGTPPCSRRGQSCSRLGNEVIVFGGWDSQCQYSDTYILDLTTYHWTAHVSRGREDPRHRSCHAADTIPSEGVKVIHGGAACSGGPYIYYNDIKVFDASVKDWVKVIQPANPPPGRAQHSLSILPDGTTVIVGGMLQRHNNDVRVNDVWCCILRPLEGVWGGSAWTEVDVSPSPLPSFSTPAKPFQVPAAAKPCFRRNECLYFYGGEDEHANASNCMYVLNARTMVWATLPSPPDAPRVKKHSLISTGANVYVAASDMRAVHLYKQSMDRLVGPAKWTRNTHRYFPKEKHSVLVALLFSVLKADLLCDDTFFIVAQFFMDSQDLF